MKIVKSELVQFVQSPQNHTIGNKFKIFLIAGTREKQYSVVHVGLEFVCFYENFF